MSLHDASTAFELEHSNPLASNNSVVKTLYIQNYCASPPKWEIKLSSPKQTVLFRSRSGFNAFDFVAGCVYRLAKLAFIYGILR